MTDQYVYVLDKEHSWIPALVTEHGKDTATVTVKKYTTQEEIEGVLTISSDTKTEKRVVKLHEYPNHALPLQNVVQGGHVADMIELSFLHEAAILYNLKARHVLHTPYTRTGDIVVAVNPYKWFPHLYSEENRLMYSKFLIFDAAKRDYDPRRDLSPHVYETSALAYFGLSQHGEHQSILVSGESGAGKTETVKICMNHLASVVQQQETLEQGFVSKKTLMQDQDVVKRVLDSNPLLEAFGNAKTRRNDNSSRFGKYLLLQFHPSEYSRRLTLSGSKCEVYLLEKARVVHHDDAERNFHIFYQLLAAKDGIKGKFWKGLVNTDYDSFAYVGDTDTTSIEGVSDADQFQRTLESLELIGIKGELLKTMMKAICVVLQLGNVQFGEDPKNDEHAIVTSKRELHDLSELMGIEQSFFATTLTYRKVIVRNERHMVHLKPETARESTDALAKQIYDKVFLWLVRTINKATTATPLEGESDQIFGTIGLLDIFGFESFPVNSLEQLCINYANEQLQSKFTEDVFKSVFEEYRLEGIPLEEIHYDDNTEVLDLIQNRTGLLAMLNEECIRPNGSDYGFVNKALHANKDSPALIVPRIVQSKVEFGIRHYAGDVLYNATDFVTKNQDTLPTDLLECAQSSTNSIIAAELKPEAFGKGDTGGTKKGPRQRKSNLVAPTAWSKYKSQLNKLMTDLKKSNSRYIRCIKPNSLKKPSIMQHEMTLEQLRSSGVIAAVTLSRSAFPNRLEHQIVLERFYTLRPKGMKIPTTKELNTPDKLRQEADTLMAHVFKGVTLKGSDVGKGDSANKAHFVAGRTRMYFRSGALEYLEAERLRGMEPAAVKIQKVVRGFIGRKKAWKVRYAKELAELASRGDSSVVIQCAWRVCVAKRSVKKLLKEKKAKEKRQRELKLQKKAATKIQCAVRGKLARKERERRYVKYIKEQAKKLKKEKKLKQQSKAASVIQKHGRGMYVRSKYVPILKKIKERNALKEKLRKLKKKISKSEKIRQEELEKIEKGMSADMADREVWEENVKTATAAATQDETDRMVQFLQGEHQKLKSKTRALESLVKPLKQNFESLMSENSELRKEFAEIHEKNEAMKKSNQELVDRQKKAEARSAELKAELQKIATKFMPIAHGRLDFQKALKEIMDMLEERCKDDQLYEDVTLLALQCQADAKGLQAGADAAKELEMIQFSPQARRQRIGQSFRDTTGAAGASFASPGVAKPKKKMTRASVATFASPRQVTAGMDMSPAEGKPKKSKNKKLKELNVPTL